MPSINLQGIFYFITKLRFKQPKSRLRNDGKKLSVNVHMFVLTYLQKEISYAPSFSNGVCSINFQCGFSSKSGKNNSACPSALTFVTYAVSHRSSIRRYTLAPPIINTRSVSYFKSSSSSFAHAADCNRSAALFAVGVQHDVYSVGQRAFGKAFERFSPHNYNVSDSRF